MEDGSCLGRGLEAESFHGEEKLNENNPVPRELSAGPGTRPHRPRVWTGSER